MTTIAFVSRELHEIQSIISDCLNKLEKVGVLELTRTDRTPSDRKKTAHAEASANCVPSNLTEPNNDLPVPPAPIPGQVQVSPTPSSATLPSHIRSRRQWTPAESNLFITYLREKRSYREIAGIFSMTA
jgi:hypothetical protein